MIYLDGSIPSRRHASISSSSVNSHGLLLHNSTSLSTGRSSTFSLSAGFRFGCSIAFTSLYETPGPVPRGPRRSGETGLATRRPLCTCNDYCARKAARSQPCAALRNVRRRSCGMQAHARADLVPEPLQDTTGPSRRGAGYRCRRGGRWPVLHSAVFSTVHPQSPPCSRCGCPVHTASRYTWCNWLLPGKQ